jgi:GT2 family glycosyltransferase
VSPGALDRLVECLDRNPKAGACGPQLVYPDGRPQPSGSSVITLSNLLWEQLLLDQLFPASPVFAEHFLSEWHYRRQRKLDVISGACLMVRTACLEQIGLLDANYFMYCEDVDWCRRAAAAGWDRVFVPEARVLHHHGASSRAFRPAMVRIYNESRCYYFRKFGGRDTASDAKRIMVAGARLRQATWSALSLAKKSAAAQARDWKEIAERTSAIDLDALPELGIGVGGPG